MATTHRETQEQQDDRAERYPSLGAEDASSSLLDLNEDPCKQWMRTQLVNNATAIGTSSECANQGV